MSPLAPAPDRVRLATWNVNSLRVRGDALVRLLDRAAPDLVCLQETRAAQVVPAVESALAERGYGVAHVGRGSAGGVAVVARHPITDVTGSGSIGVEVLDRDPRLVVCVVEIDGRPWRVASVYVPHGREVGHWHYAFKLEFLEALAAQVRAWVGTGAPVVLGGDVNVAPTDSDVFHPDAFVGSTHVTPHERAALAAVLDAGLVDLDVARWGPLARRFTWWNHGIGYSRNLGMRIDVLAADAATAAGLDTTWIDHVERGADRPSDHAALLADVTRPGDPSLDGS